MFGKVFRSIFYGSLANNQDALLLFVFLLTHCDAGGFVDMTVDSCGFVLRWEVQRVRAAADVLASPDPNSTSPKCDGARITFRGHSMRGVEIVNYETYKWMRSREDRREQNRLSQQRFRDRVNDRKPTVSDRKPNKPKQKQKQKQKQTERSTSLRSLSRSDMSKEGASPKDDLRVGIPKDSITNVLRGAVRSRTRHPIKEG